ncbi:MAG TPA: hypothetical protein DCR14_19865, partial [Acidimicrobiaceae bacterium]|nr:hypothetical protein [Acidimicrobiaceae bacterium]
MAVAIGVPVLTYTAPVQADDAAEQAAREIADARERANAAADTYFAAISRLDQLAIEEAALVAEVAALEDQVAELTERVQQIAVKRFTSAGTGTSPLLNGFSSPEEQMQIAALAQVINASSDVDFDDFDAASRDLADKQEALKATQQRAEDEKANAEALRIAAEQEVERLKEVEAQRLRDEAVRKALEAEERARAAAAAEQAAREAAAATTVAPDDNDSGGGNNNADGGGSAPQTTAPS